MAGLGHWRDKKDRIAMRIRQVGVKRILWGSDGAFGGGMTPEEALDAFQELPLSKSEFRTIYGNLTPYMRW